MKVRGMKSLTNWLEERVALSDAMRFLRNQLAKPVPRHVNWLFSFGTVASVFFLTQVFSGLLLMLYYEPSAGTAYDSVKFIIEKVPFGWLVRQGHAYGAHFMIAFLLLHAGRVFFYGGYKKPREMTWFFGFGLLAITLLFGFTGYLLPWDQLAYWATVVGTEVAGSVPIVGERVLFILRGGETVSDGTLTRFFAVHVIVLPWAFVFLVLGHLFLIRYQGISTLDRTDVPEKTSDEISLSGGKPFYPQHVLKEIIVVLLVFAGMVLMIVYNPIPLHDPADPFNTPIGVKPEWYFLPAYQAMKYVPEMVGVVGTGLVVLALFLLPLLDRSPERHPGKRPIAIFMGVGFMLFAILLGVLGYLSDTNLTIMGTLYHFDVYGWPQIIASP
jgi:ubiquinol-cytochrome c reductase cytochrome b subunit